MNSIPHGMAAVTVATASISHMPTRMADPPGGRCVMKRERPAAALPWPFLTAYRTWAVRPETGKAGCPTPPENPEVWGVTGSAQFFFCQSRRWELDFANSSSCDFSSASLLEYSKRQVVLSRSVRTFEKPSALVRSPRTEAAQPPHVMFGTEMV